MNHQEIVERRDQLGVEQSAAYEAEQSRIAKELESLQELCGAMGHCWGVRRIGNWAVAGKICVYCDAQQP